jgi:hypothetical protein
MMRDQSGYNVCSLVTKRDHGVWFDNTHAPQL